MQFKIFQISILGDSDAESAMNKFLRTHRVITVQRELACSVSGSFWCFCVEYIDAPISEMSPSNILSWSKKNSRIDYKEVLSESDFSIFSKIRELRKELALAESIPVYTVCTNDHLAQMVLKRCSTISAFQQIPGFGDAKIQKYGKQFLDILQTSFNEENTDETNRTNN